MAIEAGDQHLAAVCVAAHDQADSAIAQMLNIVGIVRHQQAAVSQTRAVQARR